MSDLIWDEATYLAAYNVKDRLGIGLQGNGRLRYEKALYDTYKVAEWQNRLTELGAKLQMSMGSSILVVGCGFGYTVEYARSELQAGRIWGTDTSPYIQATKGDPLYCNPTIEPAIFNVDITAVDAADQFKALGTTGNGKFNWVFTEFVVESIDPLTFQAFLDACDALRTGPGDVAHLFAGWREGDPPVDALGIRRRTLADWVAERPAHLWLDWHGYVVGGGV